jgi:hypothetical protein
LINTTNISLNLEKCMFLVHIGNLPDPKKISAFVHMPTPKTPREFFNFLIA